MADITKIQPIGSSTQYELGARYLTTARTLTIGDTGKTFDGTANVSWSKAEILGSSDSHHFLRGDGTWSNTLESSSGSTLIQLVNTYNGRTDRNLWLIASTSMGLLHTPAKDSTSGYKWIIRLNGDQTAIMADYPYQGTFMNQALTSSTVNSLSGSWFGSGSGDPWPNTDWCVIQCGDGIDKWQLHSLDGAHLEFRQNDNGGTNTSWGAWHSYVDRAGDSMTGNLTTTGSLLSRNLILYHTGFTRGSAPSSTCYTGIYFADSSKDTAHPGGRTCLLENSYATNKTNQISMAVYSPVAGSSSTNRALYVNCNSSSTFTAGANCAFYGAVWNDYAEFRETKEKIEPGRCIVENGDDTLSLSTERLQRGCEVVSDTFGFAIGKTKRCQTPTAASGRVLVYLYEDKEEAKKKIGWPVCSGPDGTVSIMTEEEEEKYPSRIIGTISAVPDYEIWYAETEDDPIEIKVNGRIWIRIR